MQLSRVNNFVEACCIGNKRLDPVAEAAGPSDAGFATTDDAEPSNLGFASFGEMLGLPWDDCA